MRILIDEQLPVKLKYRFTEIGYNVLTVKDLGWFGVKNGELLKLMVLHQLDVLITNDKSLHFQQKLSDFPLIVFNINTRTNEYEDVMEVFDEIIQKLDRFNELLKKSDSGPGIYMVRK